MRGSTGTRLVALLAGLPLALGVAAAEGRPPAGKRDRTIKINGPELNGARLDDDPRSLRTIDYLDLARGVTATDGKLLTGLKLEGPAIAGKRAPASVAGLLLDGLTTDGKPVRVRIDAAAPAADPDPRTPVNEASGLLDYTLSFQLGALDGKGKKEWKGEGDFKPLCGGKPALLIAGRWDYFSGQAGDSRRLSSKPTEVTVSCADAAIGKCAASMGYRPWGKGPGDASLDALHQACVRAVRADYCGTGESHTVAGHLVNVYDSAGVQKDTAEWKMEASWSATGASCVTSPRFDRLPGATESDTVRGYVQRVCPKLWKESGCEVAKAAGRVAALYTEHE